MKKKTEQKKRVMGRQLARELTAEQLKVVCGGSWSYTAPHGMDFGDAHH
jgi:hypothetical protein